MGWNQQNFHSCCALVKILMFSTHSMKYVWYSPKKVNIFYLLSGVISLPNAASCDNGNYESMNNTKECAVRKGRSRVRSNAQRIRFCPSYRIRFVGFRLVLSYALRHQSCCCCFSKVSVGGDKVRATIYWELGMAWQSIYMKQTFPENRKIYTRPKKKRRI